MTPSRAQRKFPQLANNIIKYCSVFYEGTHDDARTNIAIAQTAAREGATIVNYCEAVSLIRKGDLSGGSGSHSGTTTASSAQNNNSNNNNSNSNNNSKHIIGAVVRDAV